MSNVSRLCITIYNRIFLQRTRGIGLMHLWRYKNETYHGVVWHHLSLVLSHTPQRQVASFHDMEEDDYDNIDYIESHLLKFNGGEIVISKEYWEEGIAIIYVNHPEKKNAISGKMIVDFRKCVCELENWREGKAVLLCGSGDNFCSGGDLDFARATGTPREGFYMSYAMQDILKRYRKLPLVTFSLIHGPTLGGGAELAIFSDYIVVADNVKLGFVHGKMGLITAFGGTTRLLHLLGKRKAMEILLTAKIYNAEECLSLSLASKKVSTAKMTEEALDYIRQFTIHHSSIVQSFKQIVSQDATNNFEKELVFERLLFCPTWGSDLNREALNKHIRHIKK